MSRKERIALIALIIAIGCMVVFFGMRKVNYHMDEVWNYGLANSTSGIVPDIEYGKVYEGYGPFASFMQVSKNDRFDYVNVWKNQANDVHPPLSYVFLHTVCSIFADSYSKWYGIGINMFWMVMILVVLYKLSKDILGSKIGAFGVAATYGTTVLFFDTIIFIRMYAQFTFFAILLAYVVKKYWQKELTRKFYFSAGAILILGVFTHYYFLIYAFLLCFLFILNLALNKRYVEMRNSIICFASAGILYILMWYHILGHLFRGYRGKDAIGKAFSIGGLFNGCFSMLRIINKSIFAGAVIVVVILGIAAVVMKYRNKEKFFGYNTCLVLVGIFYIAIVGKIAPYIDERYIMNVGFIYVLTTFMAAKKITGLKFNNTKSYLALILLLLAINITNVATRDFYIPRDGYSEEFKETIDLVKDKLVITYVQQDWEMIGFFEPLRNSQSYVFANSDDIDTIVNNQNGKFILLTYGECPKELVERYDCKLVNTFGGGYYYSITN